MNHIGIDFSINSTGITIITPKEIKYFSFQSAKKETPPKYENGVATFYYVKTKGQEELDKLENVINLKNIIIKNIKPYLKNSDVAFENFAFGARGNRIYELAGGNYLLRQEIYSYTKNISFFSPGTIKKFGGKGNFSKEEMVNAFCNLKEDGLGTFHSYVNDYMSKRTTKCIKKPIDDVIDSFFIAAYLVFLL